MEGVKDEPLLDLLPTVVEEGTRDERGGRVLDANKLLLGDGGKTV